MQHFNLGELELLKRVAISSIKFYQKYISTLKRRPSCRFVPTCSQYGIEAISQYGFLKGTFKLLKRFLKCNPFGPHGYDPLD